jgi:uncharacterized protein (DUF952 family)
MTVYDRLNPDALYHLAKAEEWAQYQAEGQIKPASLEDEGFVHCSYGHQVPGTVEKHFAGVSGLHALRIDPDALGETDIVDEDVYGSGQEHPHAYGAIPTAAVLDATPL